MKIEKLTYTLLDIIEIIYTKKIKIILFTFILFLPLSGIKFYLSEEETHIGSITIFPSDKRNMFSEYNRYNELINDKTLDILGFKNIQFSKSLFVQDLQNRNSKNSYYVSPTRLMWDFNDILQKKLLNFEHISHIRTVPDPHGYYNDHLSSLTIDFKINNIKESTTEELKKIINDSILDSKKRFGNLIDEMSKDLEKIILHENSMKLAKFENLYELIKTLPEVEIDPINVKLSNAQKAMENFEGGENSRVIFNISNNNSDGRFSIINYCLNDKNMTFGPTSLVSTKILIDKCKEMVKKTLAEDRENIFFRFKNLLSSFKSDDFNTVNLLSNDKIKISKIASSKYLYSSLFIISLFISIFLTVIHEMLLRKRDSDMVI